VTNTEPSSPHFHLTPCHLCGYDIPPTVNTTCPECGSIWDRASECRQNLREAIETKARRFLNTQRLIWAGVVLVYAIGAYVASGMESVWSLLAVILGIGFGAVASSSIGIGLCKIGPTHQFRLHAHVWSRLLWWLHGPWLLIGGFTLLGSILALIFRWTAPDIGEVLIPIIVMIELFCWAVLSLAALIVWIGNYSTALEELGIVNAGSVVRLHVLWALMVWFGSGTVGFFGGMLGAIFMMRLLGLDSMDF